MNKALIITYYWPPSGGAGVQRWLKFVKYFPESGIEPIVLTVDPGFASYPQTDESLLKEVPSSVKVIRTKTDEPFNAYKKVSGSKSIPSGGFASGNSSSFKDALMRFIRGNFFIPDARKGWNTYAFDAACKIIETEKPDAVITSSPPHSTQLLGLKLKRKYGIRWIADLRDPWTDIYYYKKMLHTPFAKAADKKYERQVLENADQIVCVSDSIRNSFLKKSPLIRKENIAVIPNGYDEKDFQNRTATSESNKFIITYTGTIAESYAPYNFFNAIGSLIKNNPETKIVFRFTGSLPKSMHDHLRSALGEEHFEFTGYSPHEKVIEQMLSSSVLYLAIPQAEGNKGILTGKLFEYLAAERPVIATGPPDGDAASILNACNAGKMFEPDDEKGILNHLQNVLDKWKENKATILRSEAYQKYSRRSLAGQFSELIKRH